MQKLRMIFAVGIAITILGLGIAVEDIAASPLALMAATNLPPEGIQRTVTMEPVALASLNPQQRGNPNRLIR